MYETFGRGAIEACAIEIPNIALMIGAVAELVEYGRTSLRFVQGDRKDLATQVEWVS